MPKIEEVGEGGSSEVLSANGGPEEAGALVRYSTTRTQPAPSSSSSSSSGIALGLFLGALLSGGGGGVRVNVSNNKRGAAVSESEQAKKKQKKTTIMTQAFEATSPMLGIPEPTPPAAGVVELHSLRLQLGATPTTMSDQEKIHGTISVFSAHRPKEGTGVCTPTMNCTFSPAVRANLLRVNVLTQWVVSVCVSDLLPVTLTYLFFSGRRDRPEPTNPIPFFTLQLRLEKSDLNGGAIFTVTKQTTRPRLRPVQVFFGETNQVGHTTLPGTQGFPATSCFPQQGIWVTSHTLMLAVPAEFYKKS